MRGGVRIEKNQRLCHVESIDWSQITQDPLAPPIYHIYNRDKSICPGCPSTCLPDSTGQNHLCWNYETCQKGSIWQKCEEMKPQELMSYILHIGIHTFYSACPPVC